MEFEANNAKYIKASTFNILNAYKLQNLPINSREPMVSRFCEIVLLAKARRFDEAFAHQLKYTQDLVGTFDYTTIRLLYIQLCNLQVLARLTTTSTENLEVCTRTMMKAFNYSLNDRAPLNTSRKWATYCVLLLLFKAFIRLKTLNLIRNSLRALANAQQLEFPRLIDHPKHISVGIRFYTGFYHFQNESYAEAFPELLYAFENTLKTQTRNKLSSLKYLIPVALINGYLPKEKLMYKYAKLPKERKLKELVCLMECYRELVGSIRSGNYRRFYRNLSKNEHVYLNLGVYLILERAKTICLARLVKKIYLLMDKQTRIPVAMVHSALRFCGYEFVGEDMESQLDESECLVATLIYQGLLRGYLSHEKRMIVLSNISPFPHYAELVKKGNMVN